MHYLKYKTLFSTLTIILSLTTIATFVLCVGNGGILNDLDEAYEVMVDLEQTGRLQSPPDTISKYVLNEIRNYKNSEELKDYIHEMEQSGNAVEKAFYISIILLISLLAVRIGLRLMRKGEVKG